MRVRFFLEIVKHVSFKENPSSLHYGLRRQFTIIIIGHKGSKTKIIHFEAPKTAN